MGVKDTVTVKLLRKNHIFADVFNYFIYGGEERIDPDALMEMDTRELIVAYGGKNGAKLPVQRTRDVLKTVVSMTDKRTAYLILGLEAQSDIHYAMPVRDMLYNSLNYAQQVEKAAESHRLSGDLKGASSGEFLSGFKRGDRLLPVVTLIVYFGSSRWDGPTSIHEMLGISELDIEIRKFIPDYRINLVEPAAMQESDFSKLHSELRQVLMAIKASGDKESLERMLQSDDFLKLGRDEIDVVNACTNARLTVKDNQEVISMRDAWDELRDEIREEARKEARKEAREEADAEVKAAKAEAEAEVEAAKAEAEAEVEAAKAEAAAEKAKAETAQKRVAEMKELFESIFGDSQQRVEGVIDLSNSKEREALMNLLKYVQ